MKRRACEPILGLLRDYAERDLPAELRARVEDHVHDCHDCGVALSQTELEVLRIRRLFDLREPPLGFTASVMDRVRAEAARPASPLDTPPPEFTERVMELVAAAASDSDLPGDDARPAAWRRGLWRSAMARAARRAGARQRGAGIFGTFGTLHWVALSVGLLALLVAGGLFVHDQWLHADGIWIREISDTREAALRRQAGNAPIGSVVRADGTSMPLEGADRLQAGDQLDLAQEEVHATLVGRGRLAGIESIALSGPARLLCQPSGGETAQPREIAQLRLIRGVASVRASKPVRIDLPWPAHLRLVPASPTTSPAGRESAAADVEATIWLTEITRHDSALAHGRSFVQVRIRVGSGQVEVHRGDRWEETVRSGEIGVMDPWSALEREDDLNLNWLASLGRRGTAPSRRGAGVNGIATPAGPTWEVRGRILRRDDNQPVAFARVTLQVGGKTAISGTRLDGIFSCELPAPPPVSGPALLSVLVPKGALVADREGILVPEACAGTGQAFDVHLAPAVTVQGRVLDPQGQPVAAAALRVFEWDEVFGRGREQVHLNTKSDALGRYELSGLASERDPGTGLVVVLDHPEHPLTARADLLHGRTGTGDVDLHLERGVSAVLMLRPTAGSQERLLCMVDAPAGLWRGLCQRVRHGSLTPSRPLRLAGWSGEPDALRVYESVDGLVLRPLIATTEHGSHVFFLDDGARDVVAGHVFRGDQPAAGVSVVLGRTSGAASPGMVLDPTGTVVLAESWTGPDGSFRIEGEFGAAGFEGRAMVLEAIVEGRSTARATVSAGQTSVRLQLDAGAGGSSQSVFRGRRPREAEPVSWSRYGSVAVGDAPGLVSIHISLCHSTTGLPTPETQVFAIDHGAELAVFLGVSDVLGQLTAKVVPSRLQHLLAIHGSGALAVALPEIDARGGARIHMSMRPPIELEGQLDPEILRALGNPCVVRLDVELLEGVFLHYARQPIAGFFRFQGIPPGRIQVSVGDSNQMLTLGPGGQYRLNFGVGVINQSPQFSVDTVFEPVPQEPFLPSPTDPRSPRRPPPTRGGAGAPPATPGRAPDGGTNGPPRGSGPDPGRTNPGGPGGSSTSNR